MKILFCGDVMGRSGREAIQQYVPKLQKRFDLLIVSSLTGENATNGFGITQEICKDFLQIRVNVITTGNHIWDQREIISHIDRDKQLLRPLNYPAGTPVRASLFIAPQKGQSILVVNIMARLFMDSLDDPFKAVNDLYKKIFYTS